MSFTVHSKQFFALVDCNNFFVSCERVFNPHLWNKPVVVLSSNDGCVIARSNEAKALGIPMGAPAFQYADLFRNRDVLVYSSNFSLYGDMSQRVMQTLARFTSDMQIYSIDEAFLLLDCSLEYAKKIKYSVEQWTGIPVSIGIGATKTLAKVANHFAKKKFSSEGVFILTDYNQEEMLRLFPVEEVWGIGHQSAERLHRYNIRTAWDFRNCDDNWIKKQLSIVGLRIANELRGIVCFGLEEDSPSKKSITCSRSFGRAVMEERELSEALASYTAQAAEKLRHQESLASLIRVFLVTSSQLGEREMKHFHIVLPEPTDYTPHLIHYAKNGLHQLFRKGLNYKKIGVVLEGLVSNHIYQPDFFVEQKPPKEKQRNLMRLIDTANQKYGHSSLKFAAEGIEQPWKTKRLRSSQHFTTVWEEILTIQI